VLGFGALQLSPDRDPGALHPGGPQPGSVDLAGLVRLGLVRGLPPSFLATPPRIDASTPRARAALGWLHANCASCHNGDGPLASLGLSFEQRIGAPRGGAAAVLATAVGVVATLRPGGAEWLRLAPGHPERSLVLARAGTRAPTLQMPPFGTHLVDEEAVALLSTFVREDLAGPPATAHLAQEKQP
jgi:mono/diheme cytochrome c family protein